MSDITQNLLNTISMMTAHAVSNAHFDRTIEAVIMACEDQALGIYKVKYQDSIWRAYSNNINTKYNAGTSVYILVPGNDMSKNKTILGTVNSLGKDYIDYVSNEQNYIENGNSVITSTSGTEYGLCSYKISDTLNLLNEENFSFDVNAAKEYLSTSEYILLKADFRTNLQKQQRRAGNYGLKVKLKFKTPENSNKTYEMNYVLDIDNMVGNPYMLSVPLTQKVYFAIDGANFVSIQNIEIFSEGFEHQDDNKPDDIFISNIEIIGANTLTTQEKQGISLRFKRPKGYMFTQNDISSDVRTTIAQIRVSNKLLSSSAKVDYYWFEQDATIDAGSVYYSKYGGKGWRCLNKLNDSSATDIKFLPESDTFVRKKSQIVTERTKFKCVAIYEGKEISNTFEIINLDSNYIIEIICDREPVFYPNIDTLQLTCIAKQRSSGVEISEVEYYWRMISQHDVYESLNVNLNTLTIYSNNIRNYNDYYCSIYTKSGSLIGTAVLRITKNTIPENRYILSIINGVQLFSYNEKGESPYSSYYQSDLSIPQLSFTVTDVVTGLDVTNQVKDITWTIPLKNTLLTDENHAEYTEEPNAIEREYTILQNFAYGIQNRYSANATNNDIKLRVLIHGIELLAKTNFTFVKEGDPGTNGTGIICKIVATKNGQRVSGWLTGTYHNGIKEYNWDKMSIELWQNGQRILGGSDDLSNVKIKWEFLNNGDNTLWYTIPTETVNDVIQYTSQQIVEFNNTELDIHSAEFNNTKGYSANILKATVKFNNEKRQYFDTIPIATIFYDNIYIPSIKNNSGFKYAVYSEDGENPQYDDLIPFTVTCPEVKVPINWQVVGSIKIGRANFEKLIQTNLIKNNFKNKDLPEDGYQLYVKPKTTYDGLCVTNAIIASGIGGTIMPAYFWVHFPVHFMYNRYGHKQLNDWDGNSIQINEDKNYILAPQIGAGVKSEEDNSFTGVFMGTVHNYEGNTDQIGLFGYNSGQRTIFLDSKSGKAEFGKQGAGRVVINPTDNEAKIQGGNYEERNIFDGKQGSGMLINLTKPSIEFGSKKFMVDEQQFTVGEDKIVYDVPNNKLSLKLDQFSLRGSTIEQIAKGSDNLLIDSLTFSEEYWNKGGIITFNQEDPDGGHNAVLLTAPQSSEAYLTAKRETNNPFKVLRKYYKLSVWLKAVFTDGLDHSSETLIQTGIYFNGAGTYPIRPTLEWQEYTLSGTINTISQNGFLVSIGGDQAFTTGQGYSLCVYNPRVFYMETQEELFNRLTNNRKDQGIYLTDGRVYVNGQYINAYNFTATDKNGNITFKINDQGEVEIHPKTFDLSGKTVKQAVEAENNLLIDSDNLSTTYWTLHGTVIGGQTDPKGKNRAFRLTPVAGSSEEGFIQAKPGNNNPFKQLKKRYQLSVWLKTSTDNTSNKTIKLYLNGVEKIITPTKEWQEYTFEQQVNTVSTTMPNDLVTIGGMSSFTSSNGYDLYVYNPRVFIVESQLDTFNRLTDNGRSQGIDLENGQLYVNGQYINSKYLSATNNQGDKTFYIDGDGNVTIKPTTFSLAGKTISQIARDTFYESGDGNLLKDPINLSDTYWTKEGTITTGQNDPFGGTKAIRLTPVSGKEAYIQAKVATNNPFAVTKVKYCLGVWLRSSSNATSETGMNLHLNFTQSPTIFPTTTWKYYTFEVYVQTVASGNDLVTIGGFGTFSSSDNYSLYIYNPCVTMTDNRGVYFNRLFGGTDGFFMSPQGQVYVGATAISVDDLYALNATIGGFTIDDSSIRSNTTNSPATGSIALSHKNFTRTLTNIGDITTLRFAIGNGFGVSSSGKLYAQSGEFSGKVEANSGNIGALKIGTSDLYISGLVNGSSVDALRIHGGSATYNSSTSRWAQDPYFMAKSPYNGGVYLKLYGEALTDGDDDGLVLRPHTGPSYNTSGLFSSNSPHRLGTTIFTNGVTVRGGLSVTTGTKSVIATTKNYGQQAYYCYQTPSPMLGDLGTGQLDEKGLCIIAIDDIFFESVQSSVDYQVFLQKCGKGDLWVKEKTPEFFIVEGTPNLIFDWEIKVKQKNYTQCRYNNFETIGADYTREDPLDIIDTLDNENFELSKTEKALFTTIYQNQQFVENILQEELEGEIIL